MSGAPAERLYTYLVVKRPGHPDRVIVWDTQDISFGRATENDISIDHGELSRRHAFFSRGGTVCTVKNMSNSNGTSVNGRTIDSHALENKDVVQAADVQFVFYQVKKNPVTLGPNVEYASQLKGFGPTGAGGSPESTMLGLVDSVDLADDEDFEVRPASDFAYDLHEIELGKGPAPRNLDLEIGAPAAERVDEVAPAKEESWSLDEEVGTAPQRITLHLELEGLSGDLARAVRGLLGKTIALPALRIRVKSDDLS